MLYIYQHELDFIHLCKYVSLKILYLYHPWWLIFSYILKSHKKCYISINMNYISYIYANVNISTYVAGKEYWHFNAIYHRRHMNKPGKGHKTFAMACINPEKGFVGIGIVHVPKALMLSRLHKKSSSTPWSQCPSVEGHKVILPCVRALVNNLHWVDWEGKTVNLSTFEDFQCIVDNCMGIKASILIGVKWSSSDY